MATTRGDVNATLKDLTLIAEDTVAETRPALHPLICSMRPEEGAYTRVPVPANMPFPRKFEGERSSQGKDVPIIINYNQQTYELTIELDANLVKDARAYEFADLVREAATSSVLFPDYTASQAVINGSANNGYDGVAFYGTTHKFAGSGANSINNTVGKTGQTVTALTTDLTSAVTAIRTFLDNQGRLLNPLASNGTQNMLIHCPVALQQLFFQVVSGGVIPLAAPVTTSGTAAVPVTNVAWQGIAGVYGDGYLDANSASNWYLHYVGMPQRPFVFIENQPITVSVLGFGSEHQIKTDKVMIAIKHRFVLGYYRFDRSVKVS